MSTFQKTAFILMFSCHFALMSMTTDEKLKFSTHDETSQDEPIAIKKNLCQHSNTITNMVEDLESTDVIPLDKLDRATLLLVKDYLKIIHKMKQRTTSGIRKNKIHTKLRTLLQSLASPVLKSVIHASNFLDVKKLLKYSCHAWQQRVFSQKTLHKLYKRETLFTKPNLLLPAEIDTLATKEIGTQLAQYIYKNHIATTPQLHNKPIYKCGFGLRSVSYNHDGSFIAAGSGDHCIYIFDAHTLYLVDTLVGHTMVIEQIKFGPTHTKLLASTSADHTVRIWHLDTNICDVLEGHTKGTNAIAFNTDGTKLASTSEDKTVRIWSIPNKTCLYTINGNTRATWKVFFNTDNLITVAACDNTVKQWKLLEDQKTELKNSFEGSYGELCFNKKQTIFATDTQDYNIHLIDVETGALYRIFKGHSSPIFYLVFNHDETLLASCSKDHTIRIWDIEADTCIRTINQHTDYVYEVSFSPDGCKLISASQDCTLYMWTLLGQEKKRLLDKLQKRTLLKHAQLLWLAFTEHTYNPLNLRRYPYLKQLFDEFNTTEKKIFRKHLNILA
ncbi:MAG TPA: hypothetical protein PLU71_02105 [Candidatus Dependentiae bacterium]|nr:hypothetical protein [Candidatus Dependentiae bacterium]HRQ62623.1 hypothetical protein [Candidatus Dependentiae bacterium]